MVTVVKTLEKECFLYSYFLYFKLSAPLCLKILHREFSSLGISLVLVEFANILIYKLIGDRIHNFSLG